MAWSLFDQSAVTPKSWATSVLKAGNWPTSNANIQSLIAWALNEGGGGEYNPLNTTQTESGSSNFNNLGGGQGVQNYTSWSQGIGATVATLNNGSYPNILSDLASGNGIGSNASSNLETWSGSGYGGITGTWSEASKYMGGSATTIAGGGTGTSSASTSSTQATSTASDILDWITDPVKGTLDFATSVGDSLAAIGKEFESVGKFFDKLVMPETWIRIGAACGGVIFFVVGCMVLMHADTGAEEAVGAVGKVASLVAL
jgi:hypothetical protein